MPARRVVSKKVEASPKEARKVMDKSTLTNFDAFYVHTKALVIAKLAEMSKAGRDSNVKLLQRTTDKIIASQVRESKWV